MGGCRCTYKNCKSATKTTENLHFFHYPVKHSDRCKKWIENAGKPNFFNLAEEQLRNKVVCELHFEEKCFTNVQRKRLLHDAVPTLDVGCEEEKPPSVHIGRQYDDVQILPASADGTLFTVDTDSMQQVPESRTKVESYIYKNGTLVPLSANENDEVVYTIPDQYIGSNTSIPKSTRRAHNDNSDLFEGAVKQEIQVQKPGFHIIYNDFASSINKATQLKNHEKPADSNSPTTNDTMETDTIPADNKKSQKLMEKKFATRIKQQSKDIASIKRILKSTVAKKPLNRVSAINYLSRYLPKSLHSMVKRSVINWNGELSELEVQFLRDIYTTSPAVYDLLRNKYQWHLPDVEKLEIKVEGNK